MAVVGLVVGKFLPLDDLFVWNTAWLAGALVVGVASAAVWSYALRASPLDAAIAIDHQFELAERISSSVVLDGDIVATPAGRALVNDALQRMRRIELGTHFIYRPTRAAWWPLLPAAIAAAVIFIALPTDEPAVASSTVSQLSQQLQQAIIPVRKKLSKLQKQAEEKGLAEAKSLFKKIEQQAKQLSKTAPKDRKEALTKLNDLSSEMKQRREQLASKEQVKEQLAGMKQLQQGPAEKLSQALKAGDMKQAAAELQKMQQELTNSKLSDAQKAELAKQLEEMSKQLDEMAKKQEQARKNLQQQAAAAEAAGQPNQQTKLQQELQKIDNKDAAETRAEMSKHLQAAADKAKEGKNDDAASEIKELAEQMNDLSTAEEEIAMIDESVEIVANAKEAMANEKPAGEKGKSSQDKDKTDKKGQGQSAKAGDGKGPGQGGEGQPKKGQGQNAAQGAGEGKGQGNGKSNSGNGQNHSNKGQPGEGGGNGGIQAGTTPGKSQQPTNKIDPKFQGDSVHGKPVRGRAFTGGTASGNNSHGVTEESIRNEVEAAKHSEEDPVSGQRLSRPQRDFAKEYFDAIREGK